ncbi:hypothetical protein [Arthrobacter alpinus]|uniref:hypothetical protein n=1 Tax=Arthrobacter alpinus TaxID=656366 RepID=UPI0012FE960D|nr:hypothetical protein [Arthrobacter alpinus]
MASLNLGDRVTFDELLTAVADVHGKPIALKELDLSAAPTITGGMVRHAEVPPNAQLGMH